MCLLLLSLCLRALSKPLRYAALSREAAGCSEETAETAEPKEREQETEGDTEAETPDRQVTGGGSSRPADTQGAPKFKDPRLGGPPCPLTAGKSLGLSGATARGPCVSLCLLLLTPSTS